jgi:hypothetical protein
MAHRAFDDFVAALVRAKAQERRSIGGGAQAERPAPRSDAERAVERWVGEGGNTQTRVARRGRRP